MKAKVRFESVEEVSEFVSIANLCNFDVDVVYQHFSIDGKSLMGVLSIGLNQVLTVYSKDTNPVFEQMLRKYEAKEIKRYGNLKNI